MRSQIRLGRVFGIEIGLHYSWFVIALLISFSLSAQFRADNPAWSARETWLMAVATALLFFLSLLLHELAHSLVASTHGLQVREITLFALGGVSQIEKNPTSAKLEFWMAFVGPLTSAAIGAICVTSAHALGEPRTDPLIAMLLWLGYINFSLAVFNLLPGYPLDGGRVLRAVIWWSTGSAERSTQLAARTGQAVAFGLIMLGILEYFGGAGIGGLWIAFVGWFLLQVATESYARANLNQVLNGVRVADVMTRDYPTVDGALDLQTFVEDELLVSGRRCFIVLDNGHVAGLVTPQEIRHVDRNRWPLTSVHDVMRPLESLQAVNPDAPLTGALETMGRYDLNQLPVISNNHLDGILSRSHVLRYLQTRAELHA